MPFIVNSPYSGRPVKIRDQDIGRSIRDEEGRIFYAVPRSDGGGYYGSPTRHGSEKDEKRYFEMLTKSGRAETTAREQVLAVHDATGKPRPIAARLVALLVVLFLILAGVLGVLDATGIYDVPLLDLDDLIEVPVAPDGGGPLPLPDDAPTLPDTGLPKPQSSGLEGEGALPLSDATSVQAMGTLFDPPQPLYDEVPVAPEPAPSPATEVAVAVAERPSLEPPFVTTGSGLQWRTLTAGAPNGPVAAAGSYVLIHYDATFPGAEDHVVDTSRTTEEAGGPPIGFVLWSGQVIRGWDEGIAGMRAGEKRELIVPPHLIAAQAANMPGGSNFGGAPSTGLRFVIDLVDVLPGVVSETTRAGTVGGKTAEPGATIEVHYLGFIEGRDTPFDHSRTHAPKPTTDGSEPATEGAPLRFKVGRGEVIAGWDLGLRGMREGEVRTLVIPPYLGYGSRGVGTVIPPDATLRYEIELVRVVE